MRASIHRHRAIAGKDRIRPWTACVNPDRCTDYTTHGNVVRVDVCRCGAVRERESNAAHAVYSPWFDSELDAR